MFVRFAVARSLKRSENVARMAVAGNEATEDAAASRGGAMLRIFEVAKTLLSVMDRCRNILRVPNVRNEPRRTTAMKKHNHSSDDRPIQYRGKYSRHSRGQALTNFASGRHTGATCLKPSGRTIEALAPALSSLVFLSSS